MYNIIRIYNKQNSNSYILIGMNTEYKIKETISILSNKEHKSPLLQKEFSDYKKQLKKEYKKNSLYKYINFNLLAFDKFYSYEVLEIINELDFNLVDNYINQYRSVKRGYNQYLYDEINRGYLK